MGLLQQGAHVMKYYYHIIVNIYAKLELHSIIPLYFVCFMQLSQRAVSSTLN